MYSIELYNERYCNQWNDFVAASKNGTFLFHRSFMDYHSDRFKDHSLMVFRGDALVALLPANQAGNTLYSHQGLTYGGLLLSSKIKQQDMVILFRALLYFLHQNNIDTLYIKTIPYIYHTIPSQEAEYAYFLAKAQLIRRDSLSVIDNVAPLKIAPNRMEGVKKGAANGFEVEQSNDFAAFWEEVLMPNLLLKHHAAPVHSLAEVQKLHAAFPDNIKLYVVKNNDKIAAGTVIFETGTVAHSQYISASEDKGKTGSLDFLYYRLVTEIYKGKKYFDFGISNENHGLKLNTGLAYWKESFGARTVTQDFYTIDTGNFSLLDNVLI